jgi:hypothetical protein
MLVKRKRAIRLVKVREVARGKMAAVKRDQEALHLRSLQTPEEAQLVETLAMLTQRVALHRQWELEDKLGSPADMMDSSKSQAPMVAIRAISLTRPLDKS